MLRFSTTLCLQLPKLMFGVVGACRYLLCLQVLAGAERRYDERGEEDENKIATENKLMNIRDEKTKRCKGT